MNVTVILHVILESACTLNVVLKERNTINLNYSEIIISTVLLYYILR